MKSSFLKEIQQKVKKNSFKLSLHAHKERMEETITTEEIIESILKGQIIEDYPKYYKGHCCLIAGCYRKKYIHIVCGIKDKEVIIITVYTPKLPKWKNYKTRNK